MNSKKMFINFMAMTVASMRMKKCSLILLFV